MKKIGLVLLLIWPGIVFAQTTFVSTTVAFPHIVAGGDAGGINYVTLLQLVNNNSVSTTGSSGCGTTTLRIARPHSRNGTSATSKCYLLKTASALRALKSLPGLFPSALRVPIEKQRGGGAA